MKYRTVLADPAWTFEDTGSRINPAYEGEARQNGPHYEITSNDDIEQLWNQLRLNDVVERDSFLFLWAPNSLVLDYTAQSVARAWEHVPKQQITWTKMTNDGTRIRMGGGNYTRACTEQLLLCTRGKAKRIDAGVAGAILAPKAEHSAKPDDSYRLIERVAPGPYLELFARRRWSPAWGTWGSQAPDGLTLGPVPSWPGSLP